MKIFEIIPKQKRTRLFEYLIGNKKSGIKALIIFIFLVFLAGFKIFQHYFWSKTVGVAVDYPRYTWITLWVYFCPFLLSLLVFEIADEFERYKTSFIRFGAFHFGASLLLAIIYVYLISLGYLLYDPIYSIFPFGILFVDVFYNYFHIGFLMYWGILTIHYAYSYRMESNKEIRDNNNYCDKLVVKNNHKNLILSIEDILFIKAIDNYVQIHTKDQKPLLREKISDLEKQLDPHKFLRVHRSYLVNVNYIIQLNKDSSGAHTLILKDKNIIPLSRRRKKVIATILQEIPGSS